MSLIIRKAEKEDMVLEEMMTYLIAHGMCHLLGHTHDGTEVRSVRGGELAGGRER